LLPIPAIILGFVVHGWSKFALYLLYAIASAAVAWGLWKLQEWGRRLALAVLALGAVNSIACCVRPSLVTAYTAEINRSLGIVSSPLTPAYQNTMLIFSMSLGILFMAAIAAVLIRYRFAFRQPGAASQIA